MNAEAIASSLNARKSGAGWETRCPAHDDKRASLSIGIGGDGRVLLSCHAGCDTESVVRAAGLTMADLFQEQRQPEPETAYNYLSETGELLFQVVRRTGKRFVQRRPDGNGGWEYSLKGVRRVLYRLPGIQAADVDEPIFVVEGEKDADRLSSLGLYATTASGGASAPWLKEYTDSLSGRDVVILPDNDAPGAAHADKVARAIHGVAARVRVVRLDGLGAKGDVSDWLDGGGTKERLLEHCRASESVWATDPKPEGRVEMISALDRLASEAEQRKRLSSRVIPFNISYLDDCCLGIYPTDMVVVSAASGAGKTTVAALVAQLAAADGRRVHFFALEAHKGEIEQRMLFREIVQVVKERQPSFGGLTFARWMYGFTPVPPSIEEEARARLVKQIAGLKTFYRESRFSPADITRLFRSVRDETDLVILDHIHYVDNDDQNENRGLSATTKALREAALEMERPVIAVAHLRKKDARKPRLLPDIDDVHGSSEITKIATKVVVLAPARDQGVRDPNTALTYMYVNKDRFSGQNGYVALMEYDLNRLRYREAYVTGRFSFDGDSFDSSAAPPWWANRAITVTVRSCHLPDRWGPDEV